MTWGIVWITHELRNAVHNIHVHRHKLTHPTSFIKFQHKANYMMSTSIEVLAKNSASTWIFIILMHKQRKYFFETVRLNIHAFPWTELIPILMPRSNKYSYNCLNLSYNMNIHTMFPCHEYSFFVSIYYFLYGNYLEINGMQRRHE